MTIQKIWLSMLCLLLLGEPTHSQTQVEQQLQPISGLAKQQLSPLLWQQDFDELYKKIIRLHPNPWRSVKDKSFRLQLQKIASESSSETRQQTMAKVIRAVSSLTASGQDGMTGISHEQTAIAFHNLPLQLYWFDDGIYVTNTDKANRDLIGNRLTAMGGVAVEAVVAKIQPYISQENSSWLKSQTPLYLVVLELLAAENIPTENGVLVTTENNSGESQTRRLSGLPNQEYRELFHRAALLPESSEGSLYLHKLSQKYWFEQLNETSLFIQINQLTPEASDEDTFSDFVDLVEVELKKYQLKSLVIDLRHNGNMDGGSEDYSSFFTMLQQIEAYGLVPDIYVLIGRHTYSTGAGFATELANKTEAIFIGESTGGSPEHFTEHQSITLPNSKLSVRIATKFKSRAMGEKMHLTQEPQHQVSLSSSDYYLHQDPALQKAMYLIELSSFDL